MAFKIWYYALLALAVLLEVHFLRGIIHTDLSDVVGSVYLAGAFLIGVCWLCFEKIRRDHPRYAYLFMQCALTAILLVGQVPR